MSMCTRYEVEGQNVYEKRISKASNYKMKDLNRECSGVAPLAAVQHVVAQQSAMLLEKD